MGILEPSNSSAKIILIMKEFLSVMWKTIRDVASATFSIFLTATWETTRDLVRATFSMVILGITIVSVCAGGLFATLYWPFYPYDRLNSFVSETQKNYPSEFRFALDSKEKIEQDNAMLMTGKFYCGAKLINQHIALNNFALEDKDQKTLAIMYQNADKYLCPAVTQVASSR